MSTGINFGTSRNVQELPVRGGKTDARGGFRNANGDYVNAQGVVLPKANFWVNLGYRAMIEGENGAPDEEVFISAPTNLPLDTMTPLPTTSSNARYAKIQAMRNEFHADLMDQASQLQPGESVIIQCEDSPLAIQILHVATKAVASESTPDNRYVEKQSFFKLVKAA